MRLPGEEDHVRQRALGLAVAVIVGAMLVSASGAATTTAQKVTNINVSTRGAVIHYLRSIHVSTKHVVIQRGVRNYAGAQCPGRGWTCASTRHTVVQIAKRGGLNHYACSTAKCAVVQFASGSSGLHAATKSPSNTALCVKTTGVTQSCSISQPNATGTNKAVVWMVTPKLTGLTQSSSYTASITQGPSSAAGSSNMNLACVRQSVWLDGSTTKTNATSTTVTNDNHESISIQQNSLTGNNTVQGAAQGGTATSPTYDCGGSGSQLQQDELLTSIVNGKGGSITQLQDTATTNPQGVPAANVVTDIEQNQGSGFFGAASGLNNATFEQSTNQVAIANTSSGSVTQQQNANVPNPPYSGMVGTINQDSSQQSSAVVNQTETQCQDAVNVSPIAAPTASSPAVCPVASDPGVPSNVTLSQTQYGPEGLLTPSTNRVGRVHHYRKGYGQSQQTGAGPGVFDSFNLTQQSHQYADQTSGQHQLVQGDCASSGNGTASGGSCQAGQTAFLNGLSTADGYTAGSIAALNITCTSGHSSCVATPPPAPVIVASSKPSTVVEAGTGGTTFTWTDAATNNSVTFQCSTDNTHWTACTSGDTNAQFANTTAGQYSFYVRAVDTTSSKNASAPDSWSWSVVDASVSVTPTSSVSEVGKSQTFTITTNALPAGTTASLTSITPQFSTTPDSVDSNTCSSPTIGTNTASCTVTITNNSAASITVTATAIWHFTDGTNSADVTRATDGTHGSSSGATAQFVDANITITPLFLSNPAGIAETFTVTVTASPAGTGTPSFADPVITEAPTPDTQSGTGCDPNTKVINGNVLTCSVTVNSSVATTVDVNAFDQVTMGGVTVTRTTGDGKSGDSADASASWS
jgi:hypothetical protein